MSILEANDYPLILKTNEAAKLLRCGRRTLCALAAEGRMPGMYYGKGWKFNRDTVLEIVAHGGLDNWLNGQKITQAT
ncbi:MAG: helix-turn-helix domain-containing protein [Bacillota bacterium]